MLTSTPPPYNPPGSLVPPVWPPPGPGAKVTNSEAGPASYGLEAAALADSSNPISPPPPPPEAPLTAFPAAFAAVATSSKDDASDSLADVRDDVGSTALPLASA